MRQRCSVRLCRGIAACAVMLLALPCAAMSGAQAPDAGRAVAAGAHDATLYRVFLQDGGMLVSYGEFAQVGDSVVLSIPVGGTDSAPVLHLLTISQGEVDWGRTNQYAHAVRARRYADTRGEADFDRLTREVADTLNRAGSVDDDRQRLALAEAARRQLVEWPREHYNYRSQEIAQMATWLDQVVSELRIAAGLSSFDLALVAGAPAETPAVTLLPAPNLRERVELGLLAARRTTDAAERVSLLRAVLDAVQPVAPEGSWMAAVRARASAELATEVRLDRVYVALTRRTLSRAAAHARTANVRGLQSLVHAVLAEDSRLERARPAEVAALLTTLDREIEAARRLRLARDAWELRIGVLRAYSQEMRQPLDRMLGLRAWLTDVRQLAGPAPRSVRRLGNHAARAVHDLARIQPPSEAAGLHGTLTTAAMLAARAAAGRLDAVASGSLDTAWQASSAAAGSLMLLERATNELRGLLQQPALDRR